MANAPGPYTVERKELTRDGDRWEAIEGSWECENPFPRLRDAKRAARQLALLGDGDVTYRVVGETLQVLVTYQMDRSLLITHPGPPVRAVRVNLPVGKTVGPLSDLLASESEQASHM
jgi:hypothetical protein